MAGLFLLAGPFPGSWHCHQFHLRVTVVVCFCQGWGGHDNASNSTWWLCSVSVSGSISWVMTMPPDPSDDDCGLFLSVGPFPGSWQSHQCHLMMNDTGLFLSAGPFPGSWQCHLFHLIGTIVACFSGVRGVGELWQCHEFHLMMTVVCFSQRVHFLGHDNSACSPDSDSSGGWGEGGSWQCHQFHLMMTVVCFC